MSWRLFFLTAGGISLIASTPVAAQTTQPPSYRSSTCDALCDLANGIKGAFVSQPASAPSQASAQPNGIAAAAAVKQPAQEAVRNAKPRPIRRIAFRRDGGFRIYASDKVTGIDALQGQSVSLGLDGSLSEELAHKALAEAGVTVHEVPLDPDNGFDALSLGAVQAIAVGARDYAMMDRIPTRYGVHRLELPSHVAQNRARERTASLSSNER
jgi:hypothetical protein